MARALFRHFPNQTIYVDGLYADINGREYPLPRSVLRFVNDLDEGRPVKPFSCHARGVAMNEAEALQKSAEAVRTVQHNCGRIATARHPGDVEFYIQHWTYKAAEIARIAWRTWGGEAEVTIECTSRAAMCIAFARAAGVSIERVSDILENAANE